MHVRSQRDLQNFNAGFTLLELLLSLAVLAILSGSSYVAFSDIAERSQMDNAIHSILTLVERAKAHAQAGDSDMSWGVRIEQPFATVFKGDSYDSRDISYDEIIEISDFELEGDLEYVFQNGTGNPRASGIFTLTNEKSGEVRTLGINEKGVVEVD